MRSANLQQRTKEDEGINEIAGLSECQGRRQAREISAPLSRGGGGRGKAGADKHIKNLGSLF